MKFLFGLLLMIVLWAMGALSPIAPPAEAVSCRTIADHKVCILSLKRSAKYYWEYRAKISVDGVVRPVETYNCRHRIRVRSDGKEVQFESGGFGDYICGVLN
ncbi:hypothetical protein [Lyngbya sp. CCY1209]|uniref:hypothetical protein n=1 Tax=Lyngbya sp. CCY1209 TaxID=2886103 RepID=UPI002D1FE2F7|nr:hypothetical protein [Lyngbya sp. CCY1209]MEB3882343.1 hypothetical protein [Lyngbya sp. CCY1209]